MQLIRLSLYWVLLVQLLDYAFASPKDQPAAVNLMRKKTEAKGQSSQRLAKLAYRSSLVAHTAKEAAENRARDAQIFRKGRQLRAREALIDAKLDACKGDHFCEKEVRKQQVKIERLVAQGKASDNEINGIGDSEHNLAASSIGSWMPVLFGKGKAFNEVKA
eukprot:TRINITY_DN6375_c0_g1_i1.p1 TRINITY_DN6375_c0_g1~~TRINITY_DN6375_c0_g1_i1.p1  ORF type:complete len:162 (+),score=46.10 TRINITY_DN6375_c0_g1_i1:111-596(+)